MSRFWTVAIVALFVAQAALAVDYTYTGGATGTDMWNSPATWGGVGFPNSYSDTAYFSGAVAQTIRTEVNGANPFLVGNMTLGNGLGRTTAVIVGGYIGSPGLEIGTGSTITKKDGTTDKLACKVTLDGPTTFTPMAGSLYTYGMSGAGGVIKDGNGYLTFEGDSSCANTYFGLTYLKTGRLYLSGTDGTQFIPAGGLKIGPGGRLQYSTPGSGNHIADTCPVELAGGDLVPNGNAETVGVATLTANCTLYGTPTDSGFHFANSTAATWTPGMSITLQTYNSSALPKYYFGTNNTGLTAGQLAQIKFVDGLTGISTPAMYDPANTGLLVPYVASSHTYWSADFNHDFVVNFKDYIILEGNFGKTNATNAMGDADADGLVTFKDYIALEGQFNKTSTPEPATIGLLVAGGLALLRRKA